MTSSPTPMPRTRKESSKAAVAEFKHTAIPFELSQKVATSFSNCLVRGPVVIQPERKAFETSAISSSVISGGEKGIFLSFMLLMLLLQHLPIVCSCM